MHYDPARSLEEVLTELIALIGDSVGAEAVPEPPSLRRMAASKPPAWQAAPPSGKARPATTTVRPGSVALIRPQPVPRGTAWHTLPAEAVLGRQQVDFGRGLDDAEAQARLARYGPNALPEPERRSPLAILLGQFNSLPVWLLGASALLSAATGGLADAAVILGVVMINAGIGYATESQAEGIISALTTAARPPVPVVREGRVRQTPTAEVVPGDMLLLTPGCLVAADARLVSVKDLSVDESALTGESLPVSKSVPALAAADVPLADRSNMVYMGTLVTGGSGLAVVVATGRATELGLIQALVGETRPPETPMQRQLDRLGNQLVWGSLAICGAVFAVGLLRGYGFLPVLRAAISLAVAAVCPRGCPPSPRPPWPWGSGTCVASMCSSASSPPWRPWARCR